MHPTEIEKIFDEELIGNSDQEVILRTYNRLSARIVENLIQKHSLAIDDKTRKMIADILYAQSRLCYFQALTDKTAKGIGSNNIAEAVNLFKVWLGATSYLYENYDALVSEGFRQTCSKEIIEQHKELVVKKYMVHQIDSSKGILFVEPGDYGMMDNLFNVVMRFILGHDVFLSYMDEFNLALKTLREYQVGLSGFKLS